MKRKRVPNPTNVRLDNRAVDRLARVARRFNLTRSDLVRAAVNAKLPEWESGEIRFTECNPEMAEPAP
jgi:predicted transcriptional regulator